MNRDLAVYARIKLTNPFLPKYQLWNLVLVFKAVVTKQNPGFKRCGPHCIFNLSSSSAWFVVESIIGKSEITRARHMHEYYNVNDKNTVPDTVLNLAELLAAKYEIAGYIVEICNSTEEYIVAGAMRTTTRKWDFT